MAQGMFHEGIIKKRSKSLIKEHQTVATSHSSLTITNGLLTKIEQHPTSFSNPFYKAINFVQQKLSFINNEQKEQFTTIREKE
ncbi:unnamed protein product [Rotaria sp. Silwood1]|nr:unnamed protein product [Rotaria sp. Silwood1]CAF1381278.1 unnamed protein product [Rotaria sp. Silwood1]CAF3542598.1 unnamed protein product [Rotaria sp. Silwood1]CAF3568661.1 unnamed protein product [Rotaria sp. Silwood1]CAF4641734.1 unnamed protein product [Rotaria sp. Silwood1]